MNLRVGLGYDVHKLAENRDLILGGVKIPHEKGLIAHSDGDVLIHAICDAILGAANMRDIGFHFPDTSNEFKDIDSKVLLKKCVELIGTDGFVIVNIDATVSLQKPKIKDYIPQMQKVLAECMGGVVSSISIKATTTEKLGFEGREEGVSAQCVCLLQKK